MFAILAILTAAFVPFFAISTLIIFHELGHFLIAILFNVEVDKIYIYPLGGISKFNLALNESSFKEFLILIAGPLAQELTYFILINFLPQYISIIRTYHYGILFFNLLPIYPLDGGKLIHLLFETILPYKLSLIITIRISYLLTFFYFLLNISNLKLNVLFITTFLLLKIKRGEDRIKLSYEKFLLERYLNNYSFKKSKLINNKDKFYKNRRHLIKENNKYYLENEYLAKKYKKI